MEIGQPHVRENSLPICEANPTFEIELDKPAAESLAQDLAAEDLTDGFPALLKFDKQGFVFANDQDIKLFLSRQQNTFLHTFLRRFFATNPLKVYTCASLLNDQMSNYLEKDPFLKKLFQQLAVARGDNSNDLSASIKSMNLLLNPTLELIHLAKTLEKIQWVKEASESDFYFFAQALSSVVEAQLIDQASQTLLSVVSRVNQINYLSKNAEGRLEKKTRPLGIRDLAYQLFLLLPLNDYEKLLKKNYPNDEREKLPDLLLYPLEIKRDVLAGNPVAAYQPDNNTVSAIAAYISNFDTIFFFNVPDENAVPENGAHPYPVSLHELVHAYQDKKQVKQSGALSEAEAHFVDKFYVLLREKEKRSFAARGDSPYLVLTVAENTAKKLKKIAVHIKKRLAQHDHHKAAFDAATKFYTDSTQNQNYKLDNLAALADHYAKASAILAFIDEFEKQNTPPTHLQWKFSIRRDNEGFLFDEKNVDLTSSDDREFCAKTLKANYQALVALGLNPLNPNGTDLDLFEAYQLITRQTLDYTLYLLNQPGNSQAAIRILENDLLPLLELRNSSAIRITDGLHD